VRIAGIQIVIIFGVNVWVTVNDLLHRPYGFNDLYWQCRIHCASYLVPAFKSPRLGHAQSHMTKDCLQIQRLVPYDLFKTSRFLGHPAGLVECRYSQPCAAPAKSINYVVHCQYIHV